MRAGKSACPETNTALLAIIITSAHYRYPHDMHIHTLTGLVTVAKVTDSVELATMVGKTNTP